MIDIAAAAEAFRVLAQAGIGAATAAESFREAVMALPNVNQFIPPSEEENRLRQWLQGRHLMVIRRNDFQAGLEVVCQVCADRILFIPQDNLRLRSMRGTMEQIEVMAGEHYCRFEQAHIDKPVEAEPVRVIRFRRKHDSV